MTETSKRPLVTRTGLITAAIAFTLPFVADRFILSAMSEAQGKGFGMLVGIALYTSVPFLLLDSAMRPRRRVRIALWVGLALTILVWSFFAYTGYAFQSYAETANILRESCEVLKEKGFKVFLPNELEKLQEECTTYRNSGNPHVGAFMLTMICPAVIIGIMGAAAKIGEPEHVA